MRSSDSSTPQISLQSRDKPIEVQDLLRVYVAKRINGTDKKTETAIFDHFKVNAGAPKMESQLFCLGSDRGNANRLQPMIDTLREQGHHPSYLSLELFDKLKEWSLEANEQFVDSIPDHALVHVGHGKLERIHEHALGKHDNPSEVSSYVESVLNSSFRKGSISAGTTLHEVKLLFDKGWSIQGRDAALGSIVFAHSK